MRIVPVACSRLRHSRYPPTGVVHKFGAGQIRFSPKGRYLCSEMEIAALQSRGVDVVARTHAHRDFDFRRGRKLGLDDHIGCRRKPPRPAWISLKDGRALPNAMPIHELGYRLAELGFCVEGIVLATTLLDGDAPHGEKLAELYESRWDAKITLRN